MKFTKQHNLNQLHGELLQAIPELSNPGGEARLLLESSEDEIFITPLVEAANLDTRIAEVVVAHIPQEANPTDSINWDARWERFRVPMFSTAGFNRLMAENTNQEATLNLRFAAVGNTKHWQLVKQLWDACIDGVQNKPTTTELEAWNQAAANAEMPFSFGVDGKMLLAQ